LISKEHLEKVLGYVDLAKSEGAKIVCGGVSFSPSGRCANGAFMLPTILEGLGPDCRTNREEIFGPVITLQSFQNEEDVIELANASDYGLASTIWTQDIQKALHVSQRVNTGIVWVNCWLHRDLRTPFGGMNHSGVGREGGWEAMRFFTEAKNVCIKY
jgi:aminomuconate-semialdehyde/2-hydroxymuconate-6-semialdehyde dehydrogenase